MDAVSATFEKLLEYEQRCAGDEPGAGAPSRAGDWAGVIFRLGEDRLVCNVDKVHEFMPVPGYTPVPGTKSWLLGLANVRGDLLTVVDLAGFLNDTPSPITMRTRLLTASLRGRPVGLLVDEVFGQRHFASSQGSKARISANSSLRHYVSRQFRSGTETWKELDLDALFGTPEFLNGSAH